MKAPNGRDITEAVDELKREIHVRNKCYGRWTEEGKLTRAEAATRLESIVAALEFCAFIETMKSELSSHYANYYDKVKLNTDKPVA